MKALLHGWKSRGRGILEKGQRARPGSPPLALEKAWQEFLDWGAEFAARTGITDADLEQAVERARRPHAGRGRGYARRG